VAQIFRRYFEPTLPGGKDLWGHAGQIIIAMESAAVSGQAAFLENAQESSFKRLDDLAPRLEYRQTGSNAAGEG
jgi:hypothetical protein